MNKSWKQSSMVYDSTKTVEQLMIEHELICMDGMYENAILVCRRIDFVDSVVDDDESLLQDTIKCLSIKDGIRAWVCEYGKKNLE